MKTTLNKIELRAKRVREAEVDRDYFIRLAHNEGQSLRKIAEAAGVSHTQIRRILSR